MYRLETVMRQADFIATKFQQSPQCLSRHLIIVNNENSAGILGIFCHTAACPYFSSGRRLCTRR